MAHSIVFKLEIEKIQVVLIKAKNEFGGELYEAPEDSKKYAAYNGKENIDLVIKTTSFKEKTTADIEFESRTLSPEKISGIASSLINDVSPNIRTMHYF